MIRRIKNMMVKEFLQMLRDPRMRVVIFVVPIIQLVVLSFALNMDVGRIKTAVLDYDGTPSSRELIGAFSAGDYFEIRRSIYSQKEIQDLLDRGEVMAVILIPAGFEDDIMSGTVAGVQLISDGSDSNTTSIAFGYASQIVSGYAGRLMMERIDSRFGSAFMPAMVEVETRAWYNKNLESKYYYVPGLIAMMLILVSMLLTSIAIVREKEIGTIEQIMVTPIRSIEFIMGKTIPYLITGYVIMTLMFIIAMIIFGIRIQGSWILLYVLTGIYLVGNLGLAMMISVSASTQQQALLTAFFILMPVVLLSGFIFPINNMPVPVQYASYLNPMRWYLEIIRGVVMKGIGPVSLIRPIIGQSVIAVSFILLATSRFKKTTS